MLELNVEKYKFMIFFKHPEIITNFSITINNSTILRIHRRHTKVHKYPQYNSVRHLSDQPIIQRHGYTGISL